MKNLINYTIILMLTGSLFSCIPQRKFEEEQGKRKSCEKELADLKTSNQTSETKLNELNKTMADNLKLLEGLRKDTSDLGLNYRITTAKYEKLNEINEQLLEKYNRLLAGNIADTKKISGELQGTQEQLLKKQDELKALEQQLDKQKKSLDELNVELKKREARVAELEGVLKKKDDAVNVWF